MRPLPTRSVGTVPRRPLSRLDRSETPPPPYEEYESRQSTLLDSLSLAPLDRFGDPRQDQENIPPMPQLQLRPCAVVRPLPPPDNHRQPTQQPDGADQQPLGEVRQPALQAIPEDPELHDQAIGGQQEELYTTAEEQQLPGGTPPVNINAAGQSVCISIFINFC